jgi:hypothetical protein
MKQRPSAEKIRSHFHYDPVTGVFTRLSGKFAGPCGTPNNGYLKTYVGNTPYSVHVLIYVWMTGEWPVGQIDHRDGNGMNNVWANLRVGTIRFNRENLRRASRANRCGFLGVCYIGRSLRKPYRAMIGVDGKSIYLGMFATPEEAHAAYVAAKRELHEGCTL